MKFSCKMAAVLMAAACILPVTLTGCGNDPLYYRYDYDLSDYITLGEYKNLPAVVDDYTVTDEDVQREVEATLAYFAERTEIDRAPKAGDLVVYSSTVTVDGEVKEELGGTDQELTLGFDHLGSEIESALLASAAGDTFTADRTFENSALYGDYAGKTASYTITVNHIYELKNQEYSDIFVKAYMDFDSTEEYEAALRESMEKAAADGVLTSLVAQTWSAVVDGTSVISYPEKELNQILDQLEQEIRAYTDQVGVNYEEYISVRYGMNMEDFEAYALEVAQKRVKEDMIVYAIARAENLTITDEQYKEFASVYQTNYGLSSLEELEKYYTKEALTEGVLGDVVKEFVANSADISRE